MKWLEKYADYAYALMRIVTGFMFSFHGAQKILGVLSQFQPPVWSQLWFGGIIELVGGLMVLLGFQTRAAAFLCSGTMAVAYIQYHWKFQIGAQLFPAVNKGELALLCRGRAWGSGRAWAGLGVKATLYTLLVVCAASGR